MAKLHELLAVENDLKGNAHKILKETKDSFTKRKHLYNGQVKTYKPTEEGGERFADEIQTVDSTVTQRLDYTLKHIERFIDANYQKELANTQAKADILLFGGQVVAKNVPATMLLTLEKYLGALFETYNLIPTLEPGNKWNPDDKEKNLFVAEMPPQYKTKKKTSAVVLYPATKEHPAQVKEVTEDIRIGMWEIENRSGCHTPRAKSELIEKIQTLIAAVKKEKARANTQEVDKQAKIFKDFADFIMK